MADNLIINGVTYGAVPEIDVPNDQGGTTKFFDVSDADLDNASKLRDGVIAYGAGGTKYTGNMSEKSAATYTPGTSDQTIAANQYLTGAQTIKGDANLLASNILKNVSIFGVTGSLALPSISQDSTTKVLTIA
jgi:hypothetical protein